MRVIKLNIQTIPPQSIVPGQHRLCS